MDFLTPQYHTRSIDSRERDYREVKEMSVNLVDNLQALSRDSCESIS
jgi:hypothetical protein